MYICRSRRVILHHAHATSRGLSGTMSRRLRRLTSQYFCTVQTCTRRRPGRIQINPARCWPVHNVLRSLSRRSCRHTMVYAEFLDETMTKSRPWRICMPCHATGEVRLGALAAAVLPCRASLVLELGHVKCKGGRSKSVGCELLEEDD